MMSGTPQRAGRTGRPDRPARTDRTDRADRTGRSGPPARRDHPDRVEPGPALFLTTQPGWAFTSLIELRRRGVAGYIPFCHRDSSLLTPAPRRGPLSTPAEVWALLLANEAAGGLDATERLRRSLDPGLLRASATPWLDDLGHEAGAARREYSVGSEVWGETSVHRGALRDLIGDALGAALPEWRQVASGGVRFYGKADAQQAILGLRLVSNLEPGEEGRPGALRAHLASAMLTLAGVTADSTVLDPFMGSGTILRVAAEDFGVETVEGYEVDFGAFDQARANVDAPSSRLHQASFETVRPERLPARTSLVSNLPFGVRFREVPSRRLLAFLERCRAHIATIVLLVGREQGQTIGDALGLTAKNVIVLGQPATVLYSPPAATPALRS